MKLDTTGLESFPSLLAPQNDVVGDLSAAPSFDLPNSNDVSTLSGFEFHDFEDHKKKKKG